MVTATTCYLHLVEMLWNALYIFGIDPYLGMGSPPNHNMPCALELMHSCVLKLNSIASVNLNNNNVNSYTSSPDDHKESIVAFHHADAAWTTEINSQMDATRDFGYYGDANLQEYLRRPVKVLDTDWTVTAGSFQTVIDPWSLFIEDANVRKRIENYRLLQGKLCIRIAINGGPFYYGKAIAAYFPRQLENDHSFGAVNGDFYRQQLSMLPHVFLDSTTSEGGMIKTPFLNPDNWIDLAGNSYRLMGRLHIQSMNDLLHANSSSGTVNIVAYAWMEDVRLAAPTTREYFSYVAQAGGDEYGTGILSKPASAIAKVAGMLSDIPVIKPFARPTELVASTIGRVAHVFGFSRPALVDDICRSKLKGGGNLPNTDAHEAVQKLTLDSKQELCVDPRTVGLSDVDEMAFDYIKQKEAYVSQLEWLETDAGGTEIGSFIIGPDFHNSETINTYSMDLPVPMYTVATLFKYWRGSIKLRFQLVASQMHRGRIRLTYDPITHVSGTVPENEVYSRIIDLATNRDFEMVIAWNNSKSWLKVNDRYGGSFFNHSGGGPTQFLEPFHNGEVRLEVVNELTSPNPSLAQPVYINCFVSAGEDFELASPHDEIIKECEFEPQSGYEAQSGAEGEEVVQEEDGIPESPAPITSIGTEESPDNPNMHIFFGESFRSIRALLKRYCYHQALGKRNTEYPFGWVESNFPVEPGVSRAPRHITGGPGFTAYNYTAMTYLNWFTPCYVGWRGGLRSKFVPCSYDKPGYLAVRRAGRAVDQADCGHFGLDLQTANFGGWQSILLNMCGIGAGTDIIYPYVDGSMEVEFPFYVNKRFAPARAFLDGSAGDAERNERGENAGHVGFYDTGSIEGSILRYVAAGDDFSLFMFIGSPPIYRRAKPAASETIEVPGGY